MINSELVKGNHVAILMGQVIDLKLIKTISELKFIDDNNIGIELSFYPHLSDKVSQFITFLECSKNGVRNGNIQVRNINGSDYKMRYLDSSITKYTPGIFKETRYSYTNSEEIEEDLKTIKSIFYDKFKKWEKIRTKLISHVEKHKRKREHDCN